MRRVLRADRPNSPEARAREVATAMALRAAGVSVVIDLRSEAERAKVPAHLSDESGIRQCSIPLGVDVAVPTQSGPESLSDLYRKVVRTSAKGFVAVLETIARHRGETVLLHCHGGRDRTGLTAAMLLLLAGVRMPDVLRDQAIVGCLVSNEVRRRRERWIAKGRDPNHSTGPTRARCSPRRERCARSSATMATPDATCSPMA
jgi:protein-tyrosine phosphatase